ncbi:hypothetical protein [Ornithinimicrobium faecis]|uniref:hypothetical protein n=1 Tax=Ornithinimicrobium faecis TaxID=2934158 RepID=UPI0021183582|nr:hypothetical protein [Ornithinimicrobium sp. HY1745]
MDWTRLWGQAAAAWQDQLAHVRDPKAPTPAGTWVVHELVSHIESEGRSLAPGGNGAVDLPMETLDLAVHAWDLSRATTSPLTLSDELCLALLEAFEPYVHLMAQDDAFAPPIPVSDTAAAQDRLIALTGRDPSWQADSDG